MSEVKVAIKLEGYGFSIPRTHVYVDGKFAYQSQNHPEVEKEQIQKLLVLLQVENTIVEIE